MAASRQVIGAGSRVHISLASTIGLTNTKVSSKPSSNRLLSAFLVLSQCAIEKIEGSRFVLHIAIIANDSNIE